MHFKVPTLIILSFLSKREWNSIIRAEQYEGVLSVAGQLQLPEDEPHALVQPGEGGVLGSDVLPGGRGVGQPGGHHHLVRPVEDWLPVRDDSHPAPSAVVLAELSVLGLGVAATVRVVEGNVEEEWRGDVGEKLSDQQLDVGYISACQHQARG